MKRILKLAAIVTVALLLGACSEFPVQDDPALKDQVVLNDDAVLKTVTECSPETAWAKGERYTQRGNWAMFVEFVDGGSADIIAGQNMKAGWVDFYDNGETVTLWFWLGWCLDAVDEPLKIQGYNSPPSGNPAPGQFTTFKGVPTYVSPHQFVVMVDKFDYYGIHLDVGCCD